MIDARLGDGTEVEVGSAEALRSALWIDLIDPERDEEARVETAFGIDVPTPEDMHEIEASSRVYEEDSALFLTATVLVGADTHAPQTNPVTFILTPSTLITVRHSAPSAFEVFGRRLGRHGQRYDTAVDLLLGLLETIIDRVADVLENVDRGVGEISRAIFRREEPGTADLSRLVRQIGQQGDLNSKVRESLVALMRVLTVLLGNGATPEASRARANTTARDIHSLTDHVSFVGSKINFVLDATLGLINIRQNGAIRVLSVVAVVFLPPTLIASIYGMNFQHMPELSWPWGYPAALVLMLLSAVLPWWWMKRRL